jgi:predicted alpha/beta-fold hydrolase
MQYHSTMHCSQTSRETVEVSPGEPPPTRKNHPRRHGSKKDGTYRELQALYVRICHQGRQHAFTFHTLNGTVAATNARDIYASILKEGWDAVLLNHRPSGEQAANDPTVGQFLAEVSAKAGLRNRTFRNYSNCFRTIIAEIFKIQGEGSKFDYRGNGHLQWRTKVDAV